MTTLRSLIFNAFFFTWTALILLVHPLLLPLPRRFMQRLIRSWGQSTRAGMKAILGLGIEIRGLENIPQGQVIIASKHQSAWDTTAFHQIFDDPAYVLKKELLKVPLWGTCAKKCGALIVDRAAGARALKQMVQDAKAALNRGQTIIIFPEGTRVPPGEKLTYHPGAAAMYINTGAPVVPVAVNSGLFWGRRSFLKHPGAITLEFLPAIEPGLDRRAFMARLENDVETATARLEEEARARFPGL
ncbi:MAG: 1-acyl-sn-glycerol-3-phosphate acyltransferase [Rhodospirillales bacterium]|nr:1-acyl-sn-glycerol-3-phosphate acyltransferase [Rhodospirillales bacterium]